MNLHRKELTVANRFIYYYASFLHRMYGFVLRRNGQNLPEEHYVGRLPPEPAPGGTVHVQGDPRAPRPVRKGRWGTDPAPGEIVLFRYRKRLLLGRCRSVSNRVSISAEDRRSLSIRPSALVYLTGVNTAGDPDLFRAYTASVRDLAARIDLEEIRDLLAGEGEALTLSDVADLYWNDDIDASRQTALSLHLEGGCPYFEARGETCVPLPDAEVEARKRQIETRRKQGQEWAELATWLSDPEADPYDPDTFTSRQKAWLDGIQQYALWGAEARDAASARDLLSEVVPGKSDLRRAAFELLVRRGIWSEAENLDLLRADLPLEFSKEALEAVQALDPDRICRERGRRNLRRRRAFRIRLPGVPELAFSLKRRWWTGGYELGVHIPDVASRVPSGSPLDRAASDRMAALHLPGRDLPMLPFSEDLLPVGKPAPAFSLLCRLDRNLALQRTELVRSAVCLAESFSPSDADAAFQAAGHPFGKALRTLGRLADRCCADRQRNRALFPPETSDFRVDCEGGEIRLFRDDPASPARRIVRELAILAGVEAGRWCAARRLPVLYEVQEEPVGRAELDRISHPVVRRHEVRRQTPPSVFRPEPGFHAGLGVSSLCPLVSPAERYPDLAVQRQILHFLRGEPVPHTAADLDCIRFRAAEELPQFDGLRFRAERDGLLRYLGSARGQEFRAVVLYLRRDGALAELLDFPLRTVVHPRWNVEVGTELRLRLTGVDRWKGHAHFAVQES